MSRPSSDQILPLATAISENTAKFDKWLSSQGIATPSFDKSVREGLDFPSEISAAREAIIEGTAELQALVLGPLDYVQQQMREHNRLLAFQGINRFNIATSFPSDEAASYKEISQACNLAESDLKRILRFAMTQHIFRETHQGLVAHTALSRLLRKDPVRSYVGWVCDEMWPSAARAVDAMEKWSRSEEPSHTGFSLTNNTNDTMFTELSKFPDRSSRFAGTMSMMSSGPGFGSEYLLEAFPMMAKMGPMTFVDIGGSHGSFSIAVAQNCPDAHCIVQDLPDTVALAGARLAPELQGRVEFMVHDFFVEQPVKGADVYFLRWVFHDWSDKYCIKILQCLIPALKNGTRVIASEMVVPLPGAVPISQERAIRHMDLAMLELNNSKEREADDWRRLFQAADPRFKLQGIQRPPKSKMSFIEFSWIQ